MVLIPALIIPDPASAVGNTTGPTIIISSVGEALDSSITYPTNGLVDELVLCKGVLSASTIAAWYDGGMPVTPG